MKKVLLIVIAAAVGVGIYMLMQSNKMVANGQSSEIAPITSDTMTPATDTTAPAADTSKDNTPAMDTTAPADNGTIPPCPSTPDNSTPGTMMQDGKQVPCMPSSDNAQGTMQHSMTDMQNTAPADTTQQAAPATDTTAPESVQSKEDAAMNGATANPGAPIDNSNETTK